jgi:hypothetical protein
MRHIQSNIWEIYLAHLENFPKYRPENGTFIPKHVADNIIQY